MIAVVVHASLVRVEAPPLLDRYVVPSRLGERWIDDKTQRAVCPVTQAAINAALQQVRHG